jgi:peptidoglycan/LPS O-acetylase OafA/YrhL/type II secretory pathway pseudopilin PulG
MKRNVAAAVTTIDNNDDASRSPPVPESPNEPQDISNPYTWSSSLDSESPLLTSERCSSSLGTFFQDASYLAVATEASSHPTGLMSLYAQPWVYAGGGLGNMDECPLQNCLAGAGTRRDSLTFASVCMVPECTAYDLAAEDFNSAVERNLVNAVDPVMAQEYLTLNTRIASLNKFLGTGWVCGDFQVPWSFLPFGMPYIVIMIILAVLAVTGTMKKRGSPKQQLQAQAQAQAQRQQQQQQQQLQLQRQNTATGTTVVRNIPGSHPTHMGNGYNDDEQGDQDQEESAGLLEHAFQEGQEEKKQDYSPLVDHHPASSTEKNNSGQGMTTTTRKPPDIPNDESMLVTPIQDISIHPFWSAFDVSEHIQRITSQHCTETACLDGLRVGSLLWIVLGHTMAIMASSGAGFSNPVHFLPPDGLTTTIPGQLLFGSRLAVDTFLCISGFLVVHVLVRKMPLANNDNDSSSRNAVWRYVTTLPALVLHRVVRILPLYVCVLGFYTQIAPHMGNGPFWYQWLSLLQPCADYGWTNFLFVNNFVPWNLSITQTCFYHSWYLAVDMQLFLMAPLLVYMYQFHAARGRCATVVVWALSVSVTVYLSYTRHWSINTFDGAAVARFDIEAYAKPHIRAQSYLVGMYVAMILPEDVLRQRSPWTYKHVIAMLTALSAMALVTFGTASGAYARRPCQYKEWPQLDQCGSLWSPSLTFWYTALSRTVWTVGVGVVMHLCLGRSRGGNLVSSILSWKCWTPLSQLSFGVYLIHPIVIFVWQLAGREKQVFRLLTFAMDYLSVCVVSYVAALAAALLVEFPCAALWKDFVTVTTSGKRQHHGKGAFMFQSRQRTHSPLSLVELEHSSSYGAVEDETKASS